MCLFDRLDTDLIVHRIFQTLLRLRLWWLRRLRLRNLLDMAVGWLVLGRVYTSGWGSFCRVGAIRTDGGGCGKR